MSKFYGMTGEYGTNRKRATRCGHRGIRSSAQSFDGSVITTLYYDGDDLMARIEIADGSAYSGRTMFDGTLDALRTKLSA